jgi:type III secretion protein C
MDHLNLPQSPRAGKIHTLWRSVLIGYCFLSYIGGGAANSAAFKFPDSEYPYRIVDQELTVVLREFGQNLGLRVKLSQKVSGQVKGGLPKASALTFLNTICRMYGLDWYFDGSTLHVTAVTEEVTRFLPARKETPAKLTENLKRLSFYDDRFPLRSNPDNTAIVVSGPPAYVALIEQTLASMQRELGEFPTQTVIYRGGSVTVEKFVPDKAQ